jgi:hypothetical protein
VRTRVTELQLMDSRISVLQRQRQSSAERELRQGLDRRATERSRDNGKQGRKAAKLEKSRSLIVNGGEDGNATPGGPDEREEMRQFNHEYFETSVQIMDLLTMAK